MILFENKTEKYKAKTAMSISITVAWLKPTTEGMRLLQLLSCQHYRLANSGVGMMPLAPQCCCVLILFTA